MNEQKKKTGTKSGKQIKKLIVKASDDQIIENALPFKERVELLAELARGVLMSEETDEGEKIYRTKPDIKALQQLNEMHKGKPQMSNKVATPTDYVPVVVIPKQQRPPEEQ